MTTKKRSMRIFAVQLQIFVMTSRPCFKRDQIFNPYPYYRYGITSRNHNLEVNRPRTGLKEGTQGQGGYNVEIGSFV
jgi:hypothetical protein